MAIAVSLKATELGQIEARIAKRISRTMRLPATPFGDRMAGAGRLGQGWAPRWEWRIAYFPMAAHSAGIFQRWHPCIFISHQCDRWGYGILSCDPFV